MIAILSSSPCIYGAPRAILNPENGFVEKLLAVLPKNPRCLFICSGPDTPYLTDKFAHEMASAFREAGIVFSDFKVLDRRTDKQAQMLIWKSDFIILAGGHVPTQNRYFQEIGLKALLRNYQGVVLGISAGTMNAAERVYAQPEEKGESAPEFKRFLTGLGITRFNVLPHYQQVKDDLLDGRRLYEDITFADSWGEAFYVFVDGTYLLVEDGHTTLCGEAFLLRNGVIKKICESGQTLTLEG